MCSVINVDRIHGWRDSPSSNAGITVNKPVNIIAGMFLGALETAIMMAEVSAEKTDHGEGNLEDKLDRRSHYNADTIHPLVGHLLQLFDRFRLTRPVSDGRSSLLRRKVLRRSKISRYRFHYLITCGGWSSDSRWSMAFGVSTTSHQLLDTIQLKWFPVVNLLYTDGEFFGNGRSPEPGRGLVPTSDARLQVLRHSGTRRPLKKPVGSFERF